MTHIPPTDVAIPRRSLMSWLLAFQFGAFTVFLILLVANVFTWSILETKEANKRLAIAKQHFNVLNGSAPGDTSVAKEMLTDLIRRQNPTAEQVTVSAFLLVIGILCYSAPSIALALRVTDSVDWLMLRLNIIPDDGNLDRLEAFTIPAGFVRWSEIVDSRSESLLLGSSLFTARFLLHEFRSPIMLALVALEELTQHVADSASLEKIRSRIERSRSYLNNLEEWAHQRSPLNESSLPVISVSEIVHKVVKGTSHLRDEKRVELVSDDFQCLVRGYPSIIEAAIENVFRNALERASTTIWVSVDQLTGSNAFVEVAIEDDGPLLSDDATRNMFQITPDLLSRNSSNQRGIGLPAVRAFVHDHGGQVLYEPIGFHGTKRFVIRLPSISALTKETTHNASQ